MSEYLTTTQSTCRVCRKLIPARVMVEADGIWFYKECPVHGSQRARVYGDAVAYRELDRYHRAGGMPREFATRAHGCPDSCGLCPEHEQHVCLPIIEITDHCNLECPICLVTNGASFHRTRVEVARMLDGLIRAEGQIDVLNLSGGEPTVNPHLREIVEECVSRAEILRVSLSTNGLILAEDEELLNFLVEKQVIISLQLDGLDDDVCRALRGRPLLDRKRRLIEACARLDAAMSLTATIVKGVNDTRMPELVDLLFSQPHILSLMLQPAAYAGTAGKLGRPARAITVPEAVVGLEGAGKGTVSAADFCPLPCSHPACFSLAFYLKIEEDRFQAIRQLVSADRYLELIQNRAIFGTDAESYARITDAVYDLWAGSAESPAEPRIGQNIGSVGAGTSSSRPGAACACNPFVTERALKAIRSLLAATASGGYSPRKAMRIGERSVKSIFVHGFMDPETFDLARARKCCQVYPQPDGRLIPACVRNCLRSLPG